MAPVGLLNIVQNLLGDRSKKREVKKSPKKCVEKRVVELVYIRESEGVFDQNISKCFRQPGSRSTFEEFWSSIAKREAEVFDAYFAQKAPDSLKQKVPVSGGYKFMYAAVHGLKPLEGAKNFHCGSLEGKLSAASSVFDTNISQQSTNDGRCSQVRSSSVELTEECAFANDSQDDYRTNLRAVPKRGFCSCGGAEPVTSDYLTAVKREVYLMTRRNLTSWLNRVTLHMKWKRSTFFIATHAFDAFVCTAVNHNASVKHLTIIAIACLFIGVSLEEEYVHQSRFSKFLGEIIASTDSKQQIFRKQLEIIASLEKGLLITRTPENYIYYFLANFKFSSDKFFNSIYAGLYKCYENSSDGVTHMHVLFDTILILTSQLFESGEYLKLRISRIVAVCINVYICAYIKPKLIYRQQQVARQIFYIDHFCTVSNVYKQMLSVYIYQKLLPIYPLLQTLLSALILFRLPVETTYGPDNFNDHFK